MPSRGAHISPNVDESTPAPGSGAPLSQRRQAAQSLGHMTLPGIPFRHHQPDKSYGNAFGNGLNPSQPSQTSVINSGNLLTPPTTLAGDNVSPISSIVNSVNSASANNRPQQQQQLPALDNYATGTTPFSMGTGTTPLAWSQGLKSLFSPPLPGTFRNNTASPSAANSNSLPPPPPSYANMGSMPPVNAGPFNAAAFNASTAAFQFNQQSSQQMPFPQAQPQTPVTANTLASPESSISQPNYPTDRPASTPSNYQYNTLSQPVSAQTSSFPTFNTTSSPLQEAPLSAPLAGPTDFSPRMASPPLFGQANDPMQGYTLRPYPQNYRLQGMAAQMPLNGPVMTNMGYPQGQMSLMGMANGIPMMSMHSGQAAQMYGHPQPPPDRPFRCDQCPQSFNRNHDLKRHKRIHLSVKPFPCGACEKSFSRKDALKRHILVKDCGRAIAEKEKSQKREGIKEVDFNTPVGESDSPPEDQEDSEEDMEEDTREEPRTHW